MKIIVDHDELKNVSKELLMCAEFLDKEINELTQSVSSLSNYWSGEAAKRFITDSSNYVNNLNKISKTMKDFGKYIDKANNTYKDRDLFMKRDIEREDVNDYE